MLFLLLVEKLTHLPVTRIIQFALSKVLVKVGICRQHPDSVEFLLQVEESIEWPEKESCGGDCNDTFCDGLEQNRAVYIAEE